MGAARAVSPRRRRGIRSHRALLPGGVRRRGAHLSRGDGGLRGARARRRRTGLLALDAQRGGGGCRRPCRARRAVGAGARRGRRARRVLADRTARRLRRDGDHDARRAGRQELAGDRAEGVGVARRGGRPVPRGVQDVGRARPPRRRNRGRRGSRGRRVVPRALPKGVRRLPPDRRDGARRRPGRPPGAARSRNARGPWRDRRRPLRHRSDRGGPARRGARHGGQVRLGAAGVRRPAPRPRSTAVRVG